MDHPKRGEIFLVRIRGRLGTEFSGHRRQIRPYLIVSRDSINKGRPRLTVAPLTSYDEYRDSKRPLWGVPIQFADDKDHHNNIIVESDVYIDPKNDTYEDENGIFEGLTVTSDGKPYRGIIDCGELWTVNSFENLAQWPELRVHKNLSSDVRWDRRCGVLRERAMLCVDAALQILIDGGVRYKGAVRYRAGEVFIANIPGADYKVSPQLCLVVSAPGVDAIRERTPVYGTTLEQCTIIPLRTVTRQQQIETNVLVNIRELGGQDILGQAVANCREIYTINWSNRNIRSPLEGYIDNQDLSKVREALRLYLHLPLIGDDSNA